MLEYAVMFMIGMIMTFVALCIGLTAWVVVEIWKAINK